MVYLETLCHFLVSDKRGDKVGVEILVTKSDKAGRGSKMADFSMTSFLKDPLVKSLQTIKTFSLIIFFFKTITNNSLLIFH